MINTSFLLILFFIVTTSELIALLHMTSVKVWTLTFKYYSINIGIKNVRILSKTYFEFIRVCQCFKNYSNAVLKMDYHFKYNAVQIIPTGLIPFKLKKQIY